MFAGVCAWGRGRGSLVYDLLKVCVLGLAQGLCRGNVCLQGVCVCAWGRGRSL